MNKDSMDILNVLSFVIGIMNYDENLTQNDKQDLMNEIDKHTSTLITELNNHLIAQDEKLKAIIEKLEVIQDDKNKNIS